MGHGGNLKNVNYGNSTHVRFQTASECRFAGTSILSPGARAYWSKTNATDVKVGGRNIGRRSVHDMILN